MKKRLKEPIQPKLRLRDRRRKMLQIKIAAGVLVGVLVIGVASLLLRLPEVTISKVEVVGTSVAGSQLVQKIAESTLSGSYAFLIPKRNTLFAPRGDIEEKITDSFPVIKETRVAYSDFNSLTITVTERTPAGLWCSAENACYFLDEGGFIYMHTDASDAYVRYQGPIENGPVGTVFLNGRFSELRTFIENTATTLNRTPLSVTIESNNDVAVSFAGGGELKFVMSEDSTGTLENIASVFASQKLKGRTDFEYADFRFGNKVYVKFKGE